MKRSPQRPITGHQRGQRRGAHRCAALQAPAAPGAPVRTTAARQPEKQIAGNGDRARQLDFGVEHAGE